MSPAAVSEDGAFLIDADPASFGVILNWLRRGKVMMNSGTNIGNVNIEADYFDVTDLKETLEEKIKADNNKKLNGSLRTRSKKVWVTNFPQ